MSPEAKRRKADEVSTGTRRISSSSSSSSVWPSRRAESSEAIAASFLPRSCFVQVRRWCPITTPWTGVLAGPDRRVAALTAPRDAFDRAMIGWIPDGAPEPVDDHENLRAPPRLGVARHVLSPTTAGDVRYLRLHLRSSWSRPDRPLFPGRLLRCLFLPPGRHRLATARWRRSGAGRCRSQLTTKSSSAPKSPPSASRSAARYRRRVSLTSLAPLTAPHVSGGCPNASIR